MAWQPDYITTSELKSYLKISDADDDAQLAVAITAASRAIDQHTSRQFGKVSPVEERVYYPCWDRRRRRWIVEFDDVQDITGLTVTVPAGAITVYRLEPVNAADKSRPYESLVVDPDSPVKPSGTAEEVVTVSALWGWSAVPVTVKQATFLQASRLFSRRTSPYGIAGSPEQGSELRLLSRLDPDVAVSLRPYIRWWAAA